MSVTLAPLSADHAEGFAAAARRSRVLHGAWTQAPATAEEVLNLVRRRQGPADYGYVILGSETSTVAGYVEITNIVRGPLQSAYLGYYMFAGHERRGCMSWALGEIIRRAWQELRLHRLEANIQPGNAASLALVRALGFRKEGYSPAYLKIGGRWCDHERWAILATEPDAAD